MTEDRETRLRRLRIRCWRRGTKEMDLLFGRYADQAIDDLSDAELDAFEHLMDQSDNDLYLWISGAETVPRPFGAAVDRVRAFHGIG